MLKTRIYLQYLIILLDDTSVAFCHADNPLKKPALMPIETLRKAILFGMKNNLMIQYVYPDYELPNEYNGLVESIDHIKIGRELKIYNQVPNEVQCENFVLRLAMSEFISHKNEIAGLLEKVTRLNICFTDIESFKDDQIGEYKQALDVLNDEIVRLHGLKKDLQVNILTDRLVLGEMHNCNAGIGNITIAPNGKLYLCPAFYYDERMGVSNQMNFRNKESNWSIAELDYALENGFEIPNKHLLTLDKAPLCRECDAFHCNRCIWLNRKLTWDNNTPSHQQCVVSHIERNASRELQQKLKSIGEDFETEITEINYLDPFDVRKEY